MKTQMQTGPLWAWMLTLLFAGLSADAAVERYKIEAEYLNRLAELGIGTLSEGFESSAWDGARSPNVNDHNSPPQRRQSEHHVDRRRQGHLGQRFRHPRARHDDQQ